MRHVKNEELIISMHYRCVRATPCGCPDIVVFINGLPLAIIELKNPADEKANVWTAFNQLVAVGGGIYFGR